MNIFLILLAVYILGIPLALLLHVRLHHEETWTMEENVQALAGQCWLVLFAWPLLAFMDLMDLLSLWVCSAERGIVRLAIRLVVKKS